IDWLPEAAEHFTSCPLGHFEKEFFERVQGGEDVGVEFFIWWHQARDALFLKQAARSMIVQYINWLPPETDEERETLTATLACLEQAYALDPNLAFPAAEWVELAQLSGDTALAETLQSRFGDVGEATLGYRRGIVSSNVNGWRFSHSGKMHADRDPDGALVYWDDKGTIRLSTATVEFNGEVSNKSEALLNSAMGNEAGYAPMGLRNAEVAAQIRHTQTEEDGQLLWYTSLLAALEGELLILSLFYEDQRDRDWAVRICASVTR
ncbi:MAG: hypothetical protein FWD84_07260, partial [Oscillospiraceae bacterium]|nr:hypothetical protein [Oscillospiraceae bacterium]